MKTKRYGIIRLLAIVGLLAAGISSAYAGRRDTGTTPPDQPPVVNEDLPVVSAP